MKRYKPKNKTKFAQVISKAYNETIDKYKDLKETLNEEKSRRGNSDGDIFDLTQYEYNGKYE